VIGVDVIGMEGVQDRPNLIAKILVKQSLIYLIPVNKTKRKGLINSTISIL
jgi:hypothetical protein